MLGFGQTLMGSASEALRPSVGDVFAATAYTGNLTARTITTGINLTGTGIDPLGTGGLVWLKSRGATASAHTLYDTARTGPSYQLLTTSTGAQTNATNTLTAFGASGFSLGTNGQVNSSGVNFIAWTFRKAAGFFDIVTGAGTGAAQALNHNLGVTPGLIIARPYTAASAWHVYHSSAGTGTVYSLNTDAAAAASAGTHWGGVDPTATQFTLGSATAPSSQSFIAYLFANDASPGGICRTGSYTGNGSAAGPTVTLGWRPQYLMIKNHSAVGSWMIFDGTRGLYASSDLYLEANTTGGENNAGSSITTSTTGFQITTNGAAFNASGNTYIFTAIREPS